MQEVPKRISPSSATVRELYLKSGNRCSFPDCSQALFTQEGDFVGEICHIEAAEPGGERFNINQTNEERRHVSNLILLCRNHHAITNDVNRFPVERMKRIKTEHEKLFSDVVGAMLKTVTDHTTLTEPRYPQNLRRLVPNQLLSDDELQESLQELLPEIKKLSKVPIPTRQFFRLLVERGHKARSSIDLEVSAAEVEQAANLTTDQMREYVSILALHGFVSDVTKDDFGMDLICIPRLQSGWPLWQDLKEFCAKEDLDLSLLIISLDFEVLDEDKQ